SATCWVKRPVAESTSDTKRCSWLRASADHAGVHINATTAVAAHLRKSIIISCLPTLYEDFTIAVGLHGGHKTRLSHLLEQSRGTVVDTAQVAVDGGDLRQPLLEHQLASLIVQRVRFRICNPSNRTDAVARFAFGTALE